MKDVKKIIFSWIVVSFIIILINFYYLQTSKWKFLGLIGFIILGMLIDTERIYIFKK
jgi:hypothetical protein